MAHSELSTETTPLNDGVNTYSTNGSKPALNTTSSQNAVEEEDDDDDHDDERTLLAEKRLKLKVDIRLCTIAGLLCSLNLLDSGIISSASVTSMLSDLKLTGDRYSVAIFIFTISSIVFQLPSTIVMRFIGPRIFFSAVTIRSVDMSLREQPLQHRFLEPLHSELRLLSLPASVLSLSAPPSLRHGAK